MNTTVLALLVIALGLTVLVFHQPPRVSRAQVDVALAIRRSGVTLVITPDQTWHSQGRLRVHSRPAAAATASRTGDQIVVTFTQPLRSVTTYHISVGPVVGSHTGVTGELTDSFRTPAFPAYVLQRSGVFRDGRADRIVEVRGAAQQTFFTASDILEFADAGGYLVVNVLDQGVNRLLEVGADGRVKRDVPIPPGRAPVHDLRAQPGQGLFGFLAKRGVGQHLFVESSGRPHLPTPVAGFNGRPMNVADWGFVPGTTSAVVRDGAGHVFLVDLTHRASQPRLLGDYPAILGFLPGTPTLVVPHRAGEGVDMLDLHRGSTRRRLFASPESSRSFRLLLGTYPLTPGRFLDLEQKWGFDPGETSYQLVLRQHSQRHAVFETAPGSSTGLSVCLGPDGQQAAVTVSSAHGRSDGYPIARARSGDSVVILDLNDHHTRAVPGSNAQWCSSGPTIKATGN